MSFINKLVENNLTYKDKSEEYTLYLKIINIDGNIYDTVAFLINKMFSDERKVKTF
jgi:hypothetical protein